MAYSGVTSTSKVARVEFSLKNNLPHFLIDKMNIFIDISFSFCYPFRRIRERADTSRKIGAERMIITSC